MLLPHFGRYLLRSSFLFLGPCRDRDVQGTLRRGSPSLHLVLPKPSAGGRGPHGDRGGVLPQRSEELRRNWIERGKGSGVIGPAKNTTPGRPDRGGGWLRGWSGASMSVGLVSWFETALMTVGARGM